MRGRQLLLCRSDCGSYKALGERLRMSSLATSSQRKTIAFSSSPPIFSSFSFSFSFLEHFNFCVVVDLRTLDVHNLKIQLKYGCRNLGIIS